MNITLAENPQFDIHSSAIVVINDHDTRQWQTLIGVSAQMPYIAQRLEAGDELCHVPDQHRHVFIISRPNLEKKKVKESYQLQESIRHNTHLAISQLRKMYPAGGYTLQLCTFPLENQWLNSMAEAALLSYYDFNKYKSAVQPQEPISLVLHRPEGSSIPAGHLYNIAQATCIARNLVNEPVASLNVPQFSKYLHSLTQNSGLRMDILELDKIKSLKMNGLLAVNKGSVHPPAFYILEHKPANAANEQPLVLVGKGVMYDTGGYSLKTSPGSMEWMKADMSGAATVAATMNLLAQNQVPVYAAGLIPATDNHLNNNALLPGDVITYSNGTTVEVLNTDAEGRLILADALLYAARYQPSLVIDLATLTGSVIMALGHACSGMMGNSPEAMHHLREAGNQVYERVAELPLLEEYKELLKSEIADLSNVGPREAGCITAAKFLEHFTSYNWIHIDIAGTAFLNSPDSYRGKQATGVGVRLLYRFINNFYKIAT